MIAPATTSQCGTTHPGTCTDSHSDSLVANRIRQFLISRNRPDLRGLGIKVQGQTAVVTGRVSSFHAKQLATACCQRVAGVREVLNQIVVQPA